MDFKDMATSTQVGNVETVDKDEEDELKTMKWLYIFVLKVQFQLHCLKY